MAGDNYGEELAYWYLRLNGFFPIRDFVIHKTGGAKRPSDCDVLALRSPHVYEEIGGKYDDWDTDLLNVLRFDQKPFGVICEVKTGGFTKSDLFPSKKVAYLVGRLGLFRQETIAPVVELLEKRPVLEVEGAGVCKLLVTTDEGVDGVFIHRSISQIRKFIVGRVQKYPKDKFNDRMFFPSELFQFLIHEVVTNKIPDHNVGPAKL